MRTVIVSGQVLVEEGVPVRFNEAEILAEAASQRTRLLERVRL